MAFCSQCGESIEDDATFCPACGKPVEPSTAAQDGDGVPDETSPPDGPPPPPPPSPPTAPPPAPPSPSSEPAPIATTGSGGRSILIGVAIAATIGVVAAGAWFLWQQSTSDEPDAAPATTTSVASESTASTSTTAQPTTTSTTATTTTTTLPPTTTTLPADLISGLEANGVFVDEGSGATAESLQASVDMARAQGWDLSVVATAAEPEGGASAFAGSIATALNAGTVVVVTPTTLGWAIQETQFYPEEFDRAWSLIPETSTEDEAVRSFVTSVLGGPDSIGVMDPASAFWLLVGFDGTSTEFTFGDSGDLPMIGDWDCDGVATPAVWRPSNGDLYLRNSSSAGEADYVSGYDDLDAIPVVGDFNGNGCDNISFYHPTEGLVRVFNTPEADIDAASGTTPSDTEYFFGGEGDVPFAGDFDGDGIDTIGLFRPSTAVFYLKNTHADGPADIEFPFGATGDVPIAGDWGVEDGFDTVAVYRPDAGTFFFRYDNNVGPADETFEIGVVDALPVAGAFGLDRSG